MEKTTVEKYYNKGLSALADDNWLMAVQYFKKCQELDRSFIPAYHELADLFYANGQYDAAIAELQGALAMDPDDPEAAFALGNIYLAQNRYLEAIRVFKRLEQDIPDFAPELYYNMGVCYKHLGYPDLALENLNEALERDPSYFECLDIIGRIHLDAGRLDEAKKALLQVLDADPGNINARHSLGLVYSKQNLWKEAITQWETVLSQAPDTDEALRELGWALNMAGEYEKAVGALKKAIEMNPHNLQARIDLGAVFMSNQRLEEAISEWEQARREDPANPLIKKFITDAQTLQGAKATPGKE